MRTQPISVPGIAEPLSVERSALGGRPRLFAGATQVPLKRNVGVLTTTDGRQVPVRVDAPIMRIHPRLEVDGTMHETADEPPTVLKVLAVLPIGLVVVGGLVGALLGVVAAFGSQAVLRSQKSDGFKAGAVIGILVLAILVYVGIATAIVMAAGSTGSA